MAGRDSYCDRLRAKDLFGSSARVAPPLGKNQDSSKKTASSDSNRDAANVPKSSSGVRSKRHQKSYTIADCSISTDVSDDEENGQHPAEETASSGSSLSAVTKSFIVDKKYRRYSVSTAASEEFHFTSDEENDILEPTAKSGSFSDNHAAIIEGLKEQLAIKTEENEKLVEVKEKMMQEMADSRKIFETLAYEQAKRLAAEEMQNEMMGWMGKKWKAAEEQRMEAEREVADRDKLIEELQKMLGQQPSQSTTSPNYRQALEDKEEESFAVVHQFDSGLQDAIRTIEEKQLELNEAKNKIQELQKAGRAVNLDKEILHHSLKHWQAVVAKLLGTVSLVKKQIWHTGKTEDTEEIVAKMVLVERILRAMVEEMKSQAVFIEDF